MDWLPVKIMIVLKDINVNRKYAHWTNHQERKLHRTNHQERKFNAKKMKIAKDIKQRDVKKVNAFHAKWIMIARVVKIV